MKVEQSNDLTNKLAEEADQKDSLKARHQALIIELDLLTKHHANAVETYIKSCTKQLGKK